MEEQLIDINEIMRNTRRYWFVDGLAEILGGFVIIAIALSYVLIYQLEGNTLQMVLLAIGQPVLILLSAFFARKLITWLKQKITYPRTGFIKFRNVKPRKHAQRILLTILIAGAVSLFISFVASVLPERFLPFISSFFIAVYSWFLGYFNGVKRFYAVAVLILLFGGFISWIHLSGGMPYIYLLIGIGFIWTCSGAWTLYHYLGQTKPLQAVE